MISNYYTIATVSGELSASVVGWTLEQPYTQSKNELVLPFANPFGQSVIAAIVSCAPSANFLVIKERTSRANRNSVDIFPGIAGTIVTSVSMHPSDRQVLIVLKTGETLVFQFFGSRANVYRMDRLGIPVDSFLQRLPLPKGPAFPFPDHLSPSVPAFPPASFSGEPDVTAMQWLKKELPTFGPVLCRELLFRISVDERTPFGDISESSRRSISSACSRLIADLRQHPSPRIVYKDDEPVQFSLVSLSHLGTVKEEIQPSTSVGILRYITAQKRRDSFLSQKAAALNDLEATATKGEHALQKVRDALGRAQDPGALERSGKIIQAHLSNLQKGSAHLDAVDPFSKEETMVSIPLDPALSPARNAERYFDLAKRGRRMKEENDRRLRDLSAEIETIQGLRAQLEDVTTPQDLDAFLTAHRKQFRNAIQSAGKPGGEPVRPPFRVFTVEGGFQVWVGKNSTNNDLLTTRHTSKNDFWFHARAVGGSHVVLKLGTGKGDVSKRAKQQAASIAAYFSKMKKSTHVPVSMCLGKFVRKPKGASVGTVTIEREEVIFADPSLPGDHIDDD